MGPGWIQRPKSTHNFTWRSTDVNPGCHLWQIQCLCERNTTTTPSRGDMLTLIVLQVTCRSNLAVAATDVVAFMTLISIGTAQSTCVQSEIWSEERRNCRSRDREA